MRTQKKIIGLSIIIMILWKIIVNSSNIDSRSYVNTMVQYDSLHILTYNIQCLMFRRKSINILYDICKSFDIILLQECFADIFLSKYFLIQECKQFHIIGNTCPNTFSSKLVDSGLLILSKYPIQTYTFIPYQQSAYIDALSNKGFIHAIIQTKHTHIHIYNTHLQASYTSNDNDVLKIKLNQLECLSNYIQKQKYTNEHVIIGGDFNLNINKPSLYKMIQNYFKPFTIVIPNKPTNWVLYKDNVEIDTQCNEDPEYIPYTIDFF